MKALVKKYKITAEVELLSGLHIGGSKDNVEIGGIDNPVIKLATDNGKPYIPGSSLKGKMRCLLEQIKGCQLGENSEINDLFGASEKKIKDKVINGCPSKIIVRDAYLTSDSVIKLENSDELDMPYTENKYENTIDRITGTTVKGGIRQTERVPAGVSFAVEFVLNVYKKEEIDDSNDSLSLFKDAINAIENDYLGGCGSRGYGQVRFGGWKYYEATESSKWKMVKLDKNIIEW